jgi:hypothetical protein
LTPGAIVIAQVPVAETPFASTTLRVKLPAAVGVPVTAPVVALRVNPAGSVPTTEKVYGEVPPVTVIAPLLKATPTSPLVTEEQLSVGPAMMVIAQVPVAETPLASTTLIVKLPAAVGVPVTAPVEAFSVRPAGSVPTTEKVYGEVPPVTVIAPLLKATPTSPLVTEEQLSVGPAMIVIAQVPVAETPFASTTLSVKLPAAVGVPVTAPVVVFNVSPAGSVPTTEKV